MVVWRDVQILTQEGRVIIHQSQSRLFYMFHYMIIYYFILSTIHWFSKIYKTCLKYTLSYHSIVSLSEEVKPV